MTVSWLQGIRVTLLVLLAGLASSSWSLDISLAAGDRVDKVFADLPLMQKLSKTDYPAYQKAVSALVDENLDIRRFTRGVMGDYYGEASKQQRINFYQRVRSTVMGMVEKGVASVELDKFKKPLIHPPKKQGSKSLNMDVVTSSGRKIPLMVSFSRATESELLVVNVTVAGINLGQILRHQFSASVLINQGNLDQVIEQWQLVKI